MARDSILTNRQIEMLALAGNGMPYEDIAIRCCVSQWTVQKTLDNARGRLGSKTATLAVIKAIGIGLLVVDRAGTVHIPGRP